jgi:hypothetical protein
MPRDIYDEKHWRERAAHMRILSLEVKDPEAAAIMTKLADDYDKLADRAARRCVALSPQENNSKRPQPGGRALA